MSIGVLCLLLPRPPSRFLDSVSQGKDGGFEVKLRSIFVSVATVGLMVGPAFVHGVISSVAGAAKDCTIQGTAADDSLTGTTRADVICTRAGSDSAAGLEGNDTIRLGQGDDEATGDDGSDVVKGQADDDNELQGNDQNDRIFGGQGDDDLQGGAGNDFLKSRDNVSGNDNVNGSTETDTCVIDAGDFVTNCEL
jgi:Ca2+-binding RTX toxin-like protein